MLRCGVTRYTSCRVLQLTLELWGVAGLIPFVKD